MSCCVCKRHVIVRVHDDKGREFCSFDHRDEQKRRDAEELKRREDAARLQ